MKVGVGSFLPASGSWRRGNMVWREAGYHFPVYPGVFCPPLSLCPPALSTPLSCQHPLPPLHPPARADCLSPQLQISEKRPSCSRLPRQVPVTQSRRPAPWVSCCSVAARLPAGGPRPGPPACRLQAPRDPRAPWARRTPALPGSGEAAAMMWTSATRNRGSSWTHSISEGAGTSAHWCSYTTMRQAAWCVRGVRRAGVGGAVVVVVVVAMVLGGRTLVNLAQRTGVHRLAGAEARGQVASMDGVVTLGSGRA